MLVGVLGWLESIYEVEYVMMMLGLVEVGLGIVVVFLLVMLGKDYLLFVSVLLMDFVVMW